MKKPLIVNVYKVIYNFHRFLYSFAFRSPGTLLCQCDTCYYINTYLDTSQPNSNKSFYVIQQQALKYNGDSLLRRRMVYADVTVLWRLFILNSSQSTVFCIDRTNAKFVTLFASHTVTKLSALALLLSSLTLHAQLLCPQYPVETIR
jgi:hypothetical protein